MRRQREQQMQTVALEILQGQQQAGKSEKVKGIIEQQAVALVKEIVEQGFPAHIQGDLFQNGFVERPGLLGAEHAVVDGVG